ncbi:TetR/AcrR family transcriptional regulator [Phaeacidiphilus oryzae]|uniref:TetR/AcrR family transcriptional regulator n=1 Tax=Phaeacidiphilus oryzae TaxID=348818 RepID=UPI000569C927|nr:TetR/AcrR family transcriptional regulator [Phaeacidiphilus oryzae]
MSDEFKRRTPSRRGEGGALRQEILVAAARLLMRSGREGDLSLRAVAREVGIAAPSIYLHFRDRAELMEALTQQLYHRLTECLREAREEGAVDGPRAALRAMAQAYCGFAFDHPKHYRLMFAIERIEVARPEASPHPLWEVSQAWTEAVAACRNDPAGGPRDEAAPSDARVARLVWSSLHGMVALAMAMPFPADRAAIAEMADELLGLALAE